MTSYSRCTRLLTALAILASVLGLSAVGAPAQGSRAMGPGVKHAAGCVIANPQCLCPPGTSNPKYCALCPPGMKANRAAQKCLCPPGTKLDPKTGKCVSVRGAHICRNTVTGKPVHYTGHRKPLACLKPPHVLTRVPHDVDPHLAAIRGRVNPDHLRTHWYFQWGVCPKLNHTTKVHPIGPGHTRQVAVLLTHLKPGTTYCYRIIGKNEKGTAVGKIQRFRVPLPPSPPTRKPKHPHGFTG